MSEIRISCPHCGRKIGFTETQIGQVIDCPRCNLKVGLNVPKSKAKSASGSASASSPQAHKTAPARNQFNYLVWAAAAAGAILVIVWTTRHNDSRKSGHPNSNPASSSGANGQHSFAQAQYTDYYTNIAFSHLHIQSVNFSGVWGAVASFGMKNNGDKAITGATVEISLLDTNDSVVCAQTFIVFSGQTNAPLLPGRSWESDDNNPFIIPTVPDMWRDGPGSAKVTDLQLLK